MGLIFSQILMQGIEILSNCDTGQKDFFKQAKKCEI